MQVLAKKFIELLESQQLLSPEVTDELRRQVAESKTKLSPELLAKLLVDNGHLTKFQATKLIAEVAEVDAADEQVEQEDELGFADGQSSTVPGTEGIAEVLFDDDDPLVDVVEVDAIDDVVVCIGNSEVRITHATHVCLPPGNCQMMMPS